MSPPWGGPDYLKERTFDMKTMLRPHDGYAISFSSRLLPRFLYFSNSTSDIVHLFVYYHRNFLFSIGRGIASKVVMFLPRNVDINELAELSLSANPPWSLEVFIQHSKLFKVTKRMGFTVIDSYTVF